ncbi:MAG: crossover junction endodeoxyribonuclease RuvC [bacterium]
MPIGKQIILGIDPGIADTGWGLIEVEKNQLTHIAHGSVKTDKKWPLLKRLEKLSIDLSQIIKKYQPDRASVEELFFCNNAKTALVVGQARGVALLTLSQHNLPMQEFTPLQVKQAVTGYGRADKKQIQQMVKIILHLEKIPQPDDAADALAIAICAANNRY